MTEKELLGKFRESVQDQHRSPAPLLTNDGTLGITLRHTDITHTFTTNDNRLYFDEESDTLRYDCTDSEGNERKFEVMMREIQE